MEDNSKLKKETTGLTSDKEPGCLDVIVKKHDNKARFFFIAALVFCPPTIFVAGLVVLFDELTKAYPYQPPDGFNELRIHNNGDYSWDFKNMTFEGGATCQESCNTSLDVDGGKWFYIPQIPPTNSSNSSVTFYVDMMGGFFKNIDEGSFSARITNEGVDILERSPNCEFTVNQELDDNPRIIEYQFYAKCENTKQGLLSLPQELSNILNNAFVKGFGLALLSLLTKEVLGAYLKQKGYSDNQIFYAHQTIKALTILATGSYVSAAGSFLAGQAVKYMGFSQDTADALGTAVGFAMNPLASAGALAARAGLFAVKSAWNMLAMPKEEKLPSNSYGISCI